MRALIAWLPTFQALSEGLTVGQALNLRSCRVSTGPTDSMPLSNDLVRIPS